MSGRRIQRDRKGGYRLRLPQEERDCSPRSRPSSGRCCSTDDPSLRRLFPPAYADDAEADDEYRRLMREELLEGKLAALRVVEESAYAEHLTEEDLEGWLGALESLRLYLGTQLDVSDATYTEELDPDDPSAPALALYGYLSWLQEQAVEALSAGLPRVPAPFGGRPKPDISALRLDEDAPGGQLQARPHRLVDPLQRKHLTEQRSQLEPARCHVLEQDRKRNRRDPQSRTSSP